MQTFVSNPYDMLNSKNKLWINTLHIQSLKGGVGCKHPSDFLVILCQAIFKDFAPYQPSKDPPEKKHQRALQYVRGIFKYYHIAQPEHWSPIKDISEVDIEDTQNPGVYSFNQAVDGLRNYLTPSPDFIKELNESISKRTINCRHMTDEIVSVSSECQFYEEKLAKLKEYVENLDDSEEKKQLIALFDN